MNNQKNIKKYLPISQYLTDKISRLMPGRDIETFYIQSEGPDSKALERGVELRKKLGFTEKDFVFGRIGRADNNIFDPIGIRAFKIIVAKYPHAHYLIMSAPAALKDLVLEEKIPNVHFLPASGNEEDVWAFHSAINVLAHFRRDGETMGLNIAESMLCEKPVISHVSFMWNAHLEYLDNSFSRVAAMDNYKEYAEHMELFLNLDEVSLKKMGVAAKQKAEKLFYIKNNIKRFEQIIDQVLTAKQ